MKGIHELLLRAQKVRQSRFFVSVFKVGSGQLISQVMSLLSVPILSRLYSDVAYGNTALITSTAAILINAATFGLNSAIMKPENDEDAKSVFTTACTINFIIDTGFVLVCALLYNRIQILSVSGSYSAALIMMWLYTVLYSMSALLTVYANRKGRYNRLFINPIIGSIANFIVAIPLGLLGFGYEGFMLTYIIQYLCVCIHMMWGDFPFKRNYRFKDFIHVIVTYRDYIFYQYPANFIVNFGNEYPTQYFGRIFNAQQLGSYSMCVRIMKYPIRLIAAPISTVYFRTATEYQRQGKNLAEFTYKMVRWIFLLSAIPVALFIQISEPLFVLAFGKAWREAGALASFLIIQYVLLFCSQTVSYCRVTIEKQRINLLISIMQLIVAAVSCSVGYSVFGEMKATVMCFSLGQCIYNICDMAVNFACMNKKYLWKYLMISVPYVVVMMFIWLARQTVSI